MAALVGLKNLYYAIMTGDSDSGATYLAPVKIAGLIEAKIDPKTNTSTLYADDGPAETASVIGEVTIELKVSDLTLEAQAALLGQTVVNGTVVRKTTDISPYVALGFVASKSNGKLRFTWMLKGKFEAPGSDHKTKEDKVDFQPQTIRGTFIRRDFDQGYMRLADEESPSFAASVGNNWFTSVEPTADAAPPTVSSVTPTNNATGVVVGSTYRWTFNEAILPECVTLANFLVVKDSDGVVVAGALSQNVDKTQITFTPSGNLTAATAYRAIATTGVKDLSGNSLSAPSVTKFTTA